MQFEQRYQQILDYLYSFVDFSLVRNLRYSPEKFDLDRMVDFVEALGNPQDSYPVIHVAGTKGKGSVSALCASSLGAAGYKVALYTSPHLIDFNERLQVNGDSISHADLIDLVEANKPVIESIAELTTFEITTGLAFLYFQQQDVDIGVIEVGLGGRLDPTNVVKPLVTVITSISYDHTKILGETLAEIASEKAGIVKTGVPLVLAPQKDEARLAIERIAEERKAPLVQVGKDYLYTPVSRSLTGQSFLVWTAAEQERINALIDSGDGEEWETHRFSIPLLGYHQVENAATAYTALQMARQTGLEITESAIHHGFSSVFWPGRFEILRSEPPLILDSAHNRDSALKLRLTLDDYFPGRPVIMIFGASEDKDINGMFAELLPRVQQVIATQSFHPRAIEPEKLVELAHQFGCPAYAVPTVEEALMDANRHVEDRGVILVTGSIFVVAGIREVWFQKQSTL
jgi:dihydrofolate synthase/folylpolyglutamate synthase